MRRSSCPPRSRPASGRPQASSSRPMRTTWGGCPTSTPSWRAEACRCRAGIDLQYGVAAALVRRAVQVRDLPHASVVYGRILKYARSFPQREMGVMLVTDMHRSIGRPLISVPEFADWAASITDLVLYDMKLAVGRRERASATKLGAARTRLILEQPFIGALVLHLPLVPADPAWCATTATDARAIYFNPAWLAGLTLAQTQFVLAHEAMHCALGHFARREPSHAPALGRRDRSRREPAARRGGLEAAARRARESGFPRPLRRGNLSARAARHARARARPPLVRRQRARCRRAVGKGICAHGPGRTGSASRSRCPVRQGNRAGRGFLGRRGQRGAGARAARRAAAVRPAGRRGACAPVAEPDGFGRAAGAARRAVERLLAAARGGLRRAPAAVAGAHRALPDERGARRLQLPAPVAARRGRACCRVSPAARRSCTSPSTPAARSRSRSSASSRRSSTR